MGAVSRARRAPRPRLVDEASERSAEVDAVMARWSRKDGPGAAVAIVKDGAVVHHKGYGLANLRTGSPIGSDTVFDLASVTKQFTAMAIMMLVERGELAYSDTLRSLVPAFPPYARRITIRHLLTHTSGLSEYEELFLKRGAITMHQKPGGFEPSVAETIDLLARQRALRFQPGAQWEYSNSGYVVLAHIVERVSGRTFREFLHDHIFEPLAMRHTFVGPLRGLHSQKLATSYSAISRRARALDYTPLNAIVGDGNVYSTTADMVRWDAALAGDTLVSTSTLKEAYRPGRLTTGVTTGYGFGWSVGNYLGLRYAGHGGEWLGFRTLYGRFPDERLSVILLSNAAGFKVLEPLRAIVKLYLPEHVRTPHAAAPSPRFLRQVVGRYAFDGGGSVKAVHRDSSLWLEWKNRERVRLLPESDRVFVADGLEMMRVAFNQDRRGRVKGLEMNFVGTEVARKVKKAG